MKHHVRRAVLIVFGFLFVAFGVGAFYGIPGGHDADHHTPGHNVTHIMAGLIVLSFALSGDSGTRRSFCLVFGTIYLLIGLIGAYSPGDSLRIIPGVIEFHLADSWIHMVTGLLFFGLALLKKVSSGIAQRAYGM